LGGMAENLMATSTYINNVEENKLETSQERKI
jgi:hypothetical protein